MYISSKIHTYERGDNLHRKYWQMLMHACRPEGVLRCLEGMQGLVHADIPYLDFAISTSTY